MTQQRIDEAERILAAIGMPPQQINERSALTLLAITDLPPTKPWSQAGNPLMGITPIMNWVGAHYGKPYMPNTRESFRRQTMHQFVAGGVALYNPDKPDRPVNSPAAVYQITNEMLALIRVFGTPAWDTDLSAYLATRTTLAQQYAKARNLAQVPVRLPNGQVLQLSPGDHSDLIRAIIEEFGATFAPNSQLIYAGDTGQKVGVFDRQALEDLGVTVDKHGKMPDVVLYDAARNWMLLIEAVTSHGPVDGKRHAELAALFATCKAGLVYVSAFPDRATMRKYLAELAWESEVWIADEPEHLIHFNGDRYLGPH